MVSSLSPRLGGSIGLRHSRIEGGARESSIVDVEENQEFGHMVNDGMSVAGLRRDPRRGQLGEGSARCRLADSEHPLRSPIGHDRGLSEASQQLGCRGVAPRVLGLACFQAMPLQSRPPRRSQHLDLGRKDLRLLDSIDDRAQEDLEPGVGRHRSFRSVARTDVAISGEARDVLVLSGHQHETHGEHCASGQAAPSEDGVDHRTTNSAIAIREGVNRLELGMGQTRLDQWGLETSLR